MNAMVEHKDGRGAWERWWIVQLFLDGKPHGGVQYAANFQEVRQWTQVLGWESREGPLRQTMGVRVTKYAGYYDWSQLDKDGDPFWHGEMLVDYRIGRTS